MRAADDPRFEVFFSDEQQRLVGAVALLTGNRDVAAEAVADAIARAWERVVKGEDIDNLAAWIRVVAFNSARGAFRRRRSERLAVERLKVSQSLVAADLSDQGAEMQALLAQLPRRQREVIVMHYFLDLAVEDIAVEMEIGETTVRNFLRRARARLLGIIEAKRAAERADDTEVRRALR